MQGCLLTDSLALQGVVQRCEPGGLPDTSIAKEFFERSVERGTEMFDETADNMTGATIDLKS